MAGDVKQGPSFQFEPGEKRVDANSLSWKEAEINQIPVYPTPGIGFILNQLQICLEGAVKAGGVCEPQDESLACWLAKPGGKFHQVLNAEKAPLSLHCLSPGHSERDSDSNGASSTHRPQPAEGKQSRWLGSPHALAANQGNKPGSPSPSSPG